MSESERDRLSEPLIGAIQNGKSNLLLQGTVVSARKNTDHTSIIKHRDIRLINVHCRYISTAARGCYLNLTNRALKCPWTWDKFVQSKSLYTPHSKMLKDCTSPLNCSNLCSGYFKANNWGWIWASNVRANIAPLCGDSWSHCAI